MNETKKIPHILIIDDEEMILEIMKEALELNNFLVTAISDATIVQSLLQKESFDTIVTDINMPKITGLELLQIVKKIDSKLPVIMVTGFADMTNMMSSFRLGAHDFLKKPFNMDELIIAVSQAVNQRQLQVQNDQYHELLEEMVIDKTKELSVANQKLEDNLLGTILAMINALEASDQYTRGHSERVTSISLMIGQQLNLDYASLKTLRLGALLHDIGKIGIDHVILNKPSRLTKDEFEIIKSHPSIGLNIISPISLGQDVFNIVNQHHEKINGFGYPKGLSGKDISLFAKIVSVADTFDAMTSTRPYRKELSFEIAMEEILACSNTQFDENIAKALLQIYTKIDEKSLKGLDLLKIN